MTHPKFGDNVTNTAAGDSNPRKHGLFVRVVRRTGKMNPGIWYECTDGKGDFWQTDSRSIVPALPEQPERHLANVLDGIKQYCLDTLYERSKDVAWLTDGYREIIRRIKQRDPYRVDFKPEQPETCEWTYHPEQDYQQWQSECGKAWKSTRPIRGETCNCGRPITIITIKSGRE